MQYISLAPLPAVTVKRLDAHMLFSPSPLYATYFLVFIIS